MTNRINEEFLIHLAELETGKAQPLFYTFPVINIFREDDSKVAETLRRNIGDKLLLDRKGTAVSFNPSFDAEAVVRAELEGAEFVEEDPFTQDFVLFPDTDGGDIKECALNGYIGFKPTLGTISRYGMMTNVPSMTQVAIGAKNVEDCAKVLEAVAAVDKKDSMSRDCYIYEFVAALEENVQGMKVAVPAKTYGMELSGEKKEAFERILSILEEKGAEIERVEFDWLEYAPFIADMVKACETAMNLSGYEEHLPEELLSEVEIGNFLLNQENYETYYVKALKIRALIKDSIDIMLRDHRLILVPFVEGEDVYSISANLAGVPAMAHPSGVFMLAGANYENNLLNIASILEKEVL